jgi:dihydroorotase
LILDDAHIKTFDANFKVVPPLRSKKDIDALIRGLKDDTIDCIVSDHIPQDIENKRVEFEFALPGIIGIQTLFGLAHTYLYQHLTLDMLLQKITSKPRNILKLPAITINKNMVAKLTIFDKDAEWILTENNLKSKSKNSPFIGWRLKGRPLAIVNKNKFLEL